MAEEYILIVEDSSHVSSTIHDLLKHMGHEAKVAETGAEAQEFLRGPSPALVILDWLLPDMEGIDILRELRSGPLASIPVIMLTAKGELTSRLTGLEAGADDYLSKPFNVKELQARITAVLRRAV
jgi:DNA-binding response OmpR family regulator